MTFFTPDFGEVSFNITGIAYCGLAADGTHTGTVAQLTYGQEFTIDVDHDTLELMAYGRVVEYINIAKKIEYELSGGAVDYSALAIATGWTLIEGGTTPNQYRYTGIELGGSGTPYHAVIMSLAGLYGANTHIGLPRASAPFPSMTVTQNEFVVGSISGVSLASINANITDYADQGLVIKNWETANALPASSSDFDTFFGVS